MENNTSSTGVSNLKSSDMTEAIIFDDLTCPRCGNKLELDQRWLKGELINVRYVCKNPRCNFICLIKHSEDNMEELSPVYDKSIFNFLANFGRDIHDRISDILKGRK